MTHRRLGDHTWQELAEGDRPYVAMPLGSFEQHGPHLPLDTDTRIAEALARRLSAHRPSVVVGPTLPIGASWEHHGFPGLLSIDARILRDVLVELGHSADWAAGLVFVNGHGGNLAGVSEAAAILAGEGRKVLSWSPRLVDGDVHAGRTETSILLALAPETVRQPLPGTGYTGPLGAVVRQGVAAVSPSGVLGDPTGATAVDGSTLLDAFTLQLLSAFDGWAV